MFILLEYKKTSEVKVKGDKADWHLKKRAIFSLNSAKSFRKQARSLSLRPFIHSVHICGWRDKNDDPSIQEFWKDGKLESKQF